MRVRNWLGVGMTLVGVLGVSAASAQKESGDSANRKLDPEVRSVRLMLGMGDVATETWSGRVTLDRGEVLGIEGVRFRQGDRVTGSNSWEARSRTIRKAAAKKAQPAATKPSGPGTTGPQVVPNGVIVTLKAPADATLSVETERGNFAVPLAIGSEESNVR